ncbi:MAG TPA: hypothetical protein VKV03_02080 [Candidatus Binataceae bacterium]|nr:hypothetical protein [Candidatus Binataceae bacterium]
MRKFAITALTLLLVSIAGCGIFYQAASGYKVNKMENSLKPGMSSLEVHQMWGEPDIRNYVDQHTSIWSYAKHANSNDVTATALYTSAKEGDTGSFLDLKFNNGQLVSWNEATHTMPKKEGAGFSAGFGGSPQGGTYHY